MCETRVAVVFVVKSSVIDEEITKITLRLCVFLCLSGFLIVVVLPFLYKCHVHVLCVLCCVVCCFASISASFSCCT